MGQFLVLAGAVLWGTTGTAQAFAPQGFNPLVIGTLRLLVAGLILLPLALSRGELQQVRQCRTASLIFAALLAAGYQLCFFSGVAKTGVAIGTVVGIGSSPIIGGLLGRIFRAEHLHGRWFIAAGLAITGCALLSFNHNQAVSADLIGIILAVGAGACYAGMTLVLKEVLQKADPIGVVAVVFTIASIMLVPVLIFSELDWLWQPRALLVALHLGIVATAVPYILFTKGLQTTTVSTATILTLAEPMTATSLGIIVLGERMNLQACSGIFLIFAGLGFLIFMEQRMRRRFAR